MPNKIRVGLVGCGVIAERLYVPGIVKIPTAEFVAVCDVVEGRARILADQYNIPQVYSDFQEMLDQSGIDLVVNLTQIPYHFEVNLMALRAGKHVFTEKPLTSTVEDATTLLEEANKRGLRLVSAPVMMLSPTNQKIAQLIRDGAIGKVCYAISHNSHSGAASLLGASWTTDPTWFYKPGAGPILDMGVYGLHTLTGLLGPAKRVFAQAGISWPQRTVRTGPFKGKVIDVETEDNILITLDFGDNVFAFIDSTYCVRARKSPPMEIFGSDGTIVMNPLGSEHPISVYRDFPEHELYGWIDMKLMQDIKPFTLVAGIEHLIDCIVDPSLKIIPNAEHARHVVEIMNACYESAREGRSLELTTTF
jgi:predicted dehydrogenase